jgi:hypothetical protein
METIDIKKKTPKITDYGSYPDSPYTVELNSKYITINTEHKTMQGDDGVLYGMYEIPKGKTIMVDNTSYNKLFKGNTQVLMSMPEPSAKMFYYITEYLKPNSNQICIVREDYLKFAGYKVNGNLTYYRALDGLLDARMAGNTTCYWINPNVIFNGDRTKLKNVIVKPVDKPFEGFTKS